MTEAEWLSSADPEPSLAFIRCGIVVLVDDLPSQTERDTLRQFLQESLTRKLRLFACWCCRRNWKEFVDARSRSAVELTELFVDGLATQTQLLAAHEGAYHARQEKSAVRGKPIQYIAAYIAHGVSGYDTADVTTESAEMLVRVGTFGTLKGARTEQAQVLRCVLGNPFRPVTFNPAWRTDTAVALARQMYDSRDFGAMPILADALQDAGCEDEQVLSHCRDAGPHARGCWVVDGVLGKA